MGSFMWAVELNYLWYYALLYQIRLDDIISILIQIC